MEYNSKIRSEHIDELFRAVLSLNNLEECYRFFEDVCTIKEIKSISQRLQVARLLKLEKTYNEIEEKTGASTATIIRINRVLNYGADGYEIVFKAMENDDKPITK